MTWIIFIVGLVAAWEGVASTPMSPLALLIRFLMFLVGGGLMIGAVYMRSLGW